MNDAISEKNRVSWIELEDGFITNTPRGTDKPPTEAWLFTRVCKRTKRGVTRKKQIVTLQCAGQDDLDRQLEAFVERPDVVYLEPAHE